MRIHLIHHARQRMSERGITRTQVEDCLRYYQVSRPGDKGKIVYDYADEQGYKTSVTATIDNDKWVVVSVWRILV